MKKRNFLLLAACMLFLPGLLSCTKKKDQPINARISALVGKVTINGSSDVRLERAVVFGDVIETGKKSLCEILINEKNILKISQNTKLTFNISSDSNVLKVDKGWLAAVTKRPFTNQTRYYIKTPTMVASIRGTSLCMKIENPESTYFCVCNGSIELKKADGNTADMVVSAHHTARRYIKGKDGKIIIDKSPGLLYHDDKSVEKLAEKIDEVIDWEKPDSE